jgi:fatty acid desaturase
MSFHTRCVITAWWITVIGALWFSANGRFSLLFVGLWIVAKATCFHAITTFREMTDHYGLEPGGIFSFTRDVPSHGLLSAIVHPHFNGYHLTHHLVPSVPYHLLPKAHILLSSVDFFRERATVCDAYFRGHCVAVGGWGESGDE